MWVTYWSLCIFFFFKKQTFKNVKTIFSSQAVQKQSASGVAFCWPLPSNYLKINRYLNFSILSSIPCFPVSYLSKTARYLISHFLFPLKSNQPSNSGVFFSDSQSHPDNPSYHHLLKKHSIILNGIPCLNFFPTPYFSNLKATIILLKHNFCYVRIQ